MSEKLEASPGLALDKPAPKHTEPAKVRKPRVVAFRPSEVNKLSLKQRAEALEKKKNPTFRLMFKVDEETYERLVIMAERISMKVPDAAVRAIKAGLRHYVDMPESEYFPDPPGDVISGLHDSEAAAYRAAVSPNRDPEAMKAMLKQIGVQTS